MVISDKGSVAIDISIETWKEDWVFGRFLLCLGEERIGNPDDHGVDLKGCINWLEDLYVNPRSRFAPSLLEEESAVLWRELVNPVFSASPRSINYSEYYTKYHISHIGMSSFNSFRIVLIDDGVSKERYVWNENDGQLQSFVAPIGSLERIARKCVSWFNGESESHVINIL